MSRGIILDEQPEIIHAHNWIVHSFTPLKTWSKAKLVMSLHDYSLVCVQKRLIHQEARCSGPDPTKCLSCGTQFMAFPKVHSLYLLTYPGQREKDRLSIFIACQSGSSRGKSARQI